MRTKIEQKGLDLYNALRGPMSQMETMEEMDNFKIELKGDKEVIAECMKCAQINIESGESMKRCGMHMDWERINHYNNLIINACMDAINNEGDKIFRSYGEDFFGKKAMDQITDEQIEEAKAFAISEADNYDEDATRELFCNYIFGTFM